jgi:hypothetical protein
VVYRASWQAVSFTTPVAPGTSSDPEVTVFASSNTAWVVLATPSLVVLESRAGFELPFDSTLHIPVDDSHFAGNCATGSTLPQGEADFITENVFASVFAGLTYDAATCTVR